MVAMPLIAIASWALKAHDEREDEGRPNIATMCCAPRPIVLPQGRRSSGATNATSRDRRRVLHLPAGSECHLGPLPSLPWCCGPEHVAVGMGKVAPNHPAGFVIAQHRHRRFFGNVGFARCGASAQIPCMSWTRRARAMSQPQLWIGGERAEHLLQLDDPGSATCCSGRSCREVSATLRLVSSRTARVCLGRHSRECRRWPAPRGTPRRTGAGPRCPARASSR